MGMTRRRNTSDFYVLAGNYRRTFQKEYAKNANNEKSYVGDLPPVEDILTIATPPRSITYGKVMVSPAPQMIHLSDARSRGLDLKIKTSVEAESSKFSGTSFFANFSGSLRDGKYGEMGTIHATLFYSKRLMD